MKTKLSICIPTYNRSKFLIECLDSVLQSIVGYENQIEIIISDNASTDETREVVADIIRTYPWIIYNRNDVNIGAERNFYKLATLAIGDYIWILGDDDKLKKEAIANIINRIDLGYNLLIANYSTWTKDLSTLRKYAGINIHQDRVFVEPDELMKCFGLHLGYISSVIIYKHIFLKTSSDKFESYSDYGFSFLYVVYAGIASHCHANFIAAPIVINRSDNYGNFDWWKYFIIGTSLVFEELAVEKYSKNAMISAKHQVLKDAVIPHILSLSVKEEGNARWSRISLMLHHYNRNWLFWVVCLPVLLMPTFIARIGKKLVCIIRGVRQLSP